jgi:DNA mismatch endonuclease (patch repair protein)
MSAVLSANTEPEVKLRKLLWRHGLRYRKQYRVAGIRVDIAFPSRRIAIFVDGCFWHGCPQHYSLPKSNQPFWRNKLTQNLMRDDRNDRILREHGWTVLHLWECEVTSDFPRFVHRLEALSNKDPDANG